MTTVIEICMLFAAVILSSLLHQHVQAEDGQFYGGSMSYKIEKQADGKDLVTIELITGWVLGKGPCGPSCNRSDIGRSTRSTRPLMTAVYSDHLGFFTSDYTNKSTYKTNVQDMNALVRSTANETVIAVSEHQQWEQELLHFVFMMPNNVEELDVNFDGRAWRKLTLQSTNGRYHFQTTVSTALRSDTGKANQSPQAFAKPIYRVKLGVGTEINIPAVDADGDFIKCDMAVLAEGGDIGVFPSPNVQVFKNCTVYINASESSGYADDSWIAVPISVRDYNRKKIVYGTDDYVPIKFSMSATAVQFSVQVLANLITPEFVEPTLEGNHLFIMYADTTLRTEIYSKAPDNTTIESFTTLGIQGDNVKLSPLQQDPRRPRVQYAIMSWEPSTGEIGRHIACVSATDNTGVDSSEEKCFLLDVKGDAFNYTTQVSAGKPYFVDIPSPDQFVDCKIHATCVVAIYVKSAIAVVDIRVTESYIDKYELGPIQMVTHNGEQMYQTDLSFEHSLHGIQRTCFMARNTNGGESEKVCIQTKIEPHDPCVSAPCLNSATCVRDRATGGFICHCLSGYFGGRCETKEDKCKPDPCVQNNTIICAGVADMLCYCKPGFSGDTCAETIQKDEVCTFDDGTLCGWEQQKNDSFDWTVQSGPTQSAGTGPDVDHTLGTVQGKYIYIESSSPRRFGEHASLLSHVLPANRTMCFQFWYYMFGDGSGSLFVLFQDTRLNTETQLFKETGDKGAQWNEASVTITRQSVPNDYRIVLKADVGPTYHGDTAVDDLIIHDGPCQGSHGASIVG